MKKPLILFIGGAAVSAAALAVVTYPHWSGRPGALNVLKQSVTKATAPATASKKTATAAPARKGSATPPAAQPPSAAKKPQAQKPGERQEAAARPQPPAKAAQPAPQTPAQPPAAGTKRPTFDIVRIEEDGSAVIAGRSAPGAKVEMLLGDRVLGETTADARGEWVFVPSGPLPAGSHQLSVRALPPTGERKMAALSTQTVVLTVPEKGGKPLIVISEPSKPSRVLQKPAPEKTPEKTAAASPAPEKAPRAPASSPAPQTEKKTAAKKPPAPAPAPQTEKKTAAASPAVQRTQEKKTAAASPPPAEKPRRAGKAPEAAPQTPARPARAPARPGRRLALETVDYDENGDIFFTGRAAAGQTLRLYADNRHLGDATAGPDGKWAWRGRTKIAPGVHTLRVDRLKANGRVAERIELPFMRAEAEKVAALKAARTRKPPAPAASGEKEPKPPAATAAGKPAGKPGEKAGASDFLAAARREAATQTQPAAPAPSAAPSPADARRQETPAAAPPPGPGRVVIQPGNNLWNIARVIYGKGVRYTAIYEANREQIRNPDLIYPGQVFTTPGAAPPIRIDPKRRKPLAPQGGGLPPAR